MCSSPPLCILPNHLSRKPFTSFISDTLQDRLRSGAISLWGKVGECIPPHLVLPLTVEPSKLRLCNDDRFLNLSTADRPLSLDSIQHLPKLIKDFIRQYVMISLDTTTSSFTLPGELTLVSSGEAGTL